MRQGTNVLCRWTPPKILLDNSAVIIWGQRQFYFVCVQVLINCDQKLSDHSGFIDKDVIQNAKGPWSRYCFFSYHHYCISLYLFNCMLMESWLKSFSLQKSYVKVVENILKCPHKLCYNCVRLWHCKGTVKQFKDLDLSKRWLISVEMVYLFLHFIALRTFSTSFQHSNCFLKNYHQTASWKIKMSWRFQDSKISLLMELLKYKVSLLFLSPPLLIINAFYPFIYVYDTLQSFITAIQLLL